MTAMKWDEYRGDYAVLMVEDDWEAGVYHGAGGVEQAKAAGNLRLSQFKPGVNLCMEVELYQWRDDDHKVTRRWYNPGSGWEEISPEGDGPLAGDYDG
jgi:hypothetical protein